MSSIDDAVLLSIQVRDIMSDIMEAEGTRYNCTPETYIRKETILEAAKAGAEVGIEEMVWEYRGRNKLKNSK